MGRSEGTHQDRCHTHTNHTTTHARTPGWVRGSTSPKSPPQCPATPCCTTSLPTSGRTCGPAPAAPTGSTCVEPSNRRGERRERRVEEHGAPAGALVAGAPSALRRSKLRACDRREQRQRSYPAWAGGGGRGWGCTEVGSNDRVLASSTKPQHHPKPRPHFSLLTPHQAQIAGCSQNHNLMQMVLACGRVPT